VAAWGRDRFERELLPDWDDRLPWTHQVGRIRATEILRGHEATALIVVAASCPGEPTRADLLSIFKARAKSGVAPVLVSVTYPIDDTQVIVLFGPTADAVPVSGLDPLVAERVLLHALESATPSGLHTDLTRSLGTLRGGGAAAGIRNEGLFATHVLEQQPDSTGWAALCEHSSPLLVRRGQSLVTNLGYTLDPVPDGTVLRDKSDGHACPRSRR